MRTIKNRNEREVYMHKPVGVSATKRGSQLSIAELVKKTSVLEREKMIEQSPLYDEFKAGTPIESLDLLEYIDLGIQPLDLTDAQMLREVAREQVEIQYKTWSERREAAAKAADVRTQTEP